MPRSDRHKPARSDKGTWIVAVIVLLLVCGLAAVLIHFMLQGERQAAEHASIVHAIEQAHEDFESAGVRMRNAADKSEPLAGIALNPRPGDDKAAIVRNFLDGSLNRMLAVRNDYHGEIQRIGWDKILDPDRIAKDKDLAQSQAMIDGARAAIAKSRGNMKAALAGFREGLAGLSVTAAERAQISEGFDNDPDANGKIDATWDMEGKVVNEVDDLFGLLRRLHGKWRIVDHKFMFNDAAAMSQFDTYVTSVQDIARKAQQMQMAR